MGDLQAQTAEWVASLKLGEKLQFVSDFENGYFMGVILERHNLARGRKFKNTKDTACKFQNFKNIRDLLLENFNIDFPIQNILFSTQQLLATIRQCILKYNRDKKEAAMRKVQALSASKLTPQEDKLLASRQQDILAASKLNHTKFPKKIQEIEQKLEKYKNIKTQHELMALEDRRREIEDNRRLIDEHRLFEISKVRTNHEFIKEHERKVYDVWLKTEQVKQARIDKDDALKTFLDDKKNRLHQSLREEETRSFKEGLEAFNLNCIRQGIELEHDPDKPLRKTEDGFNKQVVMERIKDNIKIHEKERRQRIKRENKKAVDAKDANLKAEAIWNENTLVEHYAKRIHTQLHACEHTRKANNRQEAERIAAAHKNSNKTFKELPESKIDLAQREQEYRHRKIQYLDEQVERLERRQRKHRAIAENVLEALIHVVVHSEDQYKATGGFNFQEWKALEREFLAFERRDRRAKDQAKYIDASYDAKANEYITTSGAWEPFAQPQPQLQLSAVIEELIAKAYPQQSQPEGKAVPLYMPLKIAFVGDSLSGKTTLSQKVAQKYGVTLINPVAVIAEAFELNKEPVVEDTKKKKDSKKPEEENPEKLALKDWGEKLMKRLSTPTAATVEHYIEAIEFKLNYNFTQKQGEEILKEFEEAKVQEAERYGKAVKEFEQAQKKKKDPKKAESDEPPSEKKYFFSKGFVLDGIDLTISTVREIEKKLNGYLSFEERINPQGELVKETISNVVRVPKAQKDSRLVSGTFDLLIHLTAPEQALEARQTPEKPKADHKDLTSLEQYYADFGNERTKEKAYRKINNETTVEQCLSEVSRAIEQHLDAKYLEITSPKAVPEEAPTGQEQSSPPTSSPFSSLSREVCEGLLKLLTSIYSRYQRKVSECFSDLDTLRDEFGRVLLATQQSFINIINRPDDKAGKILNFQENYNKLQAEKVNIVKDAEASKHLISKLDELYDGLWVSLESKKNEAVAERQRVLASTLLNGEIEKVVEVGRALMQNELDLLVEVVFFLYSLGAALQGASPDISPEHLVLGIPPSLEPIFSFEKTAFGSDRLDYYTRQFQQCLTDLPAWLAKREKKLRVSLPSALSGVASEWMAVRGGRASALAGAVGSRVREWYLEYFCLFSVLANKMDDWIIQGIKYENEFVYDIYKTIRRSIQDARRSNIKDLFVKDITDLLHPLPALPPHRLPALPATSPSRFNLLASATLMQELRCLATAGRIPFKLFQAYLEKRRKSQLLDPELLGINLDIVQQYLVTDDYCNYRELALALLLWKVKIPEEEELADYERTLAGRGGEYVAGRQEVRLAEFAVMPWVSGDAEERRMLLALVFEVFRVDFRESVSVKEVVETLRLFSQLQVYRYGDTLMMLREAASRNSHQAD